MLMGSSNISINTARYTETRFCIFELAARSTLPFYRDYFLRFSKNGVKVIRSEGAMDSLNLITLSIPIFIFLIVVELLFNFVKGGKFYRLNDGISNLSAGIFQQIFGFIPKAISALCFTLAYENVGHFKEILTGDKLWVWILLFVLVDFVYYWFHRASHRSALLWSGHVVHHQSEEYNLTVALRQSLLQGIYGAPLMGIYGLLGFEITMVLAMTSLNTISQFWIHTRYIDKLPALLEAFINTPSHHGVHHGRNLHYIDKNYAGAFIIWDKMFGTFEPEVEEVVYGITVAPKTWSPIYDQFSTFRDVFVTGKGFGTKNGFKSLWKPPGWQPRGTESLHFEERIKYNPDMTKKDKVWASGAFISVLGLTATYLFTFGNWSLAAHCGFVGGITAGLCLISQITDGKLSKQKL